MDTTKRPIKVHKAYHAHVYFSGKTKVIARKLYDLTGEKFDLQIGRFIEKPIGPHTCCSYQIIFGIKDFDRIIQWLEENRGELTVLVHGLTGNDIKDHTDYTYWLGQEVELNLAFFNNIVNIAAL